MKRRSVLIGFVSKIFFVLLFCLAVIVFMPGHSLQAASADALEVAKTAELDPDGQFWITWEAYATGSTTTQYKPMDIVLVLDQSSSMNDIFEYQGGYTDWKWDSVQGQTNNTATYAEALDATSNLFVEIGGGFRKVTALREFNGSSYVYSISYKAADGSQQLLDSNKSSSDLIPLGFHYYTLTGMTTTTNKQALQIAVNNFLQSIYEFSSGVNGVDYRIAMVGFASYNTPYPGTTQVDLAGMENSEILSYADTPGYYEPGYARATQYALRSILNDSATLYRVVDPTLDPAVEDDILSANGGTAVDLGLQMAQDILDARSPLDKASRGSVVVVFSDGEPAITAYDEDIANRALTLAYDIKHENPESPAIIYSVGIFPGATPNDLIQHTNRFMNYVSSNYIDAGNMSNSGLVRVDPLDNYYLTAANPTDLDAAFQVISTESTGITLGESSVLRDVMSDAVKLPEGAVAGTDVIAYTVPSVLYNLGDPPSWDENNKTFLTSDQISIDETTGTVDVTGFDYRDQFVTYDHLGSKLVVRIKVNAVEGGMLKTNADNSGIYAYDDLGALVLYKRVSSPIVPVDPKSYVLDYALPITINVANAFNLNQGYARINANSTQPDGATPVYDGEYGIFTAEVGLMEITYSPRKINWDGIDSAFIYANNGARNAWYVANFLPATNVYFEDSFLQNETITDPSVSIVYDSSWTTATSSPPVSGRKQSTSVDNVFGFDQVYENEASYSAGSAHYATSNNAKASFDFTGTGFDIYSRTDSEVASISAKVFKYDENSNKLLVKILIANNKSFSGVYYQIPTLSMLDLPYGKYHIELTVGKVDLNIAPGVEGDSKITYYLDGIRIYNPIAEGSADYKAAESVYAVLDEDKANYVEVRDVLLDKVVLASMQDGNTTIRGELMNNIVFIDYNPVDDELGDTADLPTPDLGIYADYGPKNEVYLAPGQGIAFKVEAINYKAIMVGIKSPTGDVGQVTYTAGQANSYDRIVNSTADQYFRVLPTTAGYVAIKNTGDSLISITKLRVTGASISGPVVVMMVSPGLMSYVSEFAQMLSVPVPDSDVPLTEEEINSEENGQSNVDIPGTESSSSSEDTELGKGAVVIENYTPDDSPNENVSVRENVGAQLRVAIWDTLVKSIKSFLQKW